MPKFSTAEIFIKKAKIRHGESRFDYSQVIYKDSKTPVRIICTQHNVVFEQNPKAHLTTLYGGCHSCVEQAAESQKINNKNTISKKLDVKEIVASLQELYGNDTFIFDKIVYENNKTPITLVCCKHKTEIKKLIRKFKIKNYYNHCPDCKIEAETTVLKNKLLERHGMFFDYSRLPPQLNNNTVIEVKCPTHGWIKQKLAYHLKSDYGCNICGNTVNFNFKKTQWVYLANKNNKNPILYILKCKDNSEYFLKVGITINKIKDRYKSKKDLPYDWEVLLVKEGDPLLVWDLEQDIKKSNLKKHRPTIPFDGFTECYLETELPNILAIIDK